MNTVISSSLLGVLIYLAMVYVTGFVLGLTICRRRDDDKMFEYIFSWLWPMTWIFLIGDCIVTTVGEWLRGHPDISKRIGRVLDPAEMGRCVADWLDNRRNDKRKDGDAK